MPPLTPPVFELPLHGGQLGQISARLGIPISQLIDFSANINPEGPPPAVLPALRASLDDPSTLTVYPDLEQVELKQAIAGSIGGDPESIVVANGFIPLLESALRAFKVRRCLLPVPAFVEYRRTLAHAGVAIRPHVLDASTNFLYDTKALTEGDHDAILLANPQNPSGVLTNRKDILQFVSRCERQKVVVLLDEAFIDYAPAHSLTLDVERFTNLIVFRSVTKFYGVPGLRVAYAVAGASTARTMSETLAPWPISTLASRGVTSALADRPYADRTRLHNEQRRTLLKTGMEAIGIRVYPSAANFLLIRLRDAVDATDFWQRMILEHHLVMRNCSNYEALPPGHLRIAVRTQEENELLLQAAGLLHPEIKHSSLE